MQPNIAGLGRSYPSHGSRRPCHQREVSWVVIRAFEHSEIWSAIHNPNPKIILECNPFFNQSFFWNVDCCTPTSTPLQLFDCTAEWKLLLQFYTSIHSPFETWFNIGVKTENKLKTKSFTMKIDMHISGNPGLGTACAIIYSSNPGTGVQPLGVPFNTPLQLAFHTPFSGVQPKSSIPK